MTIQSEKDAKKLAAQYLDTDHIRNPHEEPTKAEELYQFWMWNPPGFAEEHPEDWGEYKIFRWIDPEAGDAGIHKLSCDMPRYFVERSEKDRDYWDALCKICADILGRSHSLARHGVTDNLDLRRWLVSFLSGDKVAPKKRRGNSARKYHSRDECIYLAVWALSVEGPMSLAAAFEWVGGQIDLSKEAVASIYKKACQPEFLDF